jgi:hypothetical protein
MLETVARENVNISLKSVWTAIRPEHLSQLERDLTNYMLIYTLSRICRSPSAHSERSPVAAVTRARQSSGSVYISQVYLQNLMSRYERTRTVLLNSGGLEDKELNSVIANINLRGRSAGGTNMNPLHITEGLNGRANLDTILAPAYRLVSERVNRDTALNVANVANVSAFSTASNVASSSNPVSMDPSGTTLVDLFGISQETVDALTWAAPLLLAAVTGLPVRP